MSPDATPSKCSVSTRAAIRATAAGNKFKMDNEHHTVQSISAWEARDRDTTATFKRAVTNRFLSSLRNFGDVRYTELQEGFKPVDELAGGNKDPENTSQAVVGAATLAQVAALDVSRPASAAGAQRLVAETARPGSSPAAPGRPKPGAGGKGTAGMAMSRCSSAPTGLDVRGSGLEKTRGAHSGAFSRGNSARIPSSAELPTIDSQRWGLEAADRFRLFSTVRSGKNNQRHLMGCGGAEGGINYKCQLCQRQHMMVTTF